MLCTHAQHKCHGILTVICVDMRSDDVFELRSTKTTRGRPYKLFIYHCTSNVRSSFFTERGVDTWNCLPSDT